MANDIVQTVAEARVDARSLSEFVFKPAGFKVARRLAPTVDTLQFYIDRFNSLNGDFSSSVSVALSILNNSVAEADGKVAYIETTVQDAINNTAVEGGVLADTFVTATANGVGTIARTQRDINAESVSIHSFGDCGNGEEDTAVFNLAMSTLSTLAKADGKPRVLRLIAGKTYILKDAKYYPLVDLVCVDGVATLKRPDVPIDVTENVAKWWRILSSTADGVGVNWDSDLTYSHRCMIKNIVFDGNKDNARWSGGYAQEQASCLYLSGLNQTDSNRRVLFSLDNISFKNSVSDGLHVRTNADVYATNCAAEKCFRGGLTVTGGNTIIRVNGWVSNDARFDTEVDGSGSNGSRTVYIHIQNYYQDQNNNNGENNIFAGGCDIGAVGQDGHLLLDNFNCGTAPSNFRSASGSTTSFKRWEIKGSSFVLKSGSTFYNPLGVNFKNVDFYVDNRDRTTSITSVLKFLMSYGGHIAPDKVVNLFETIKVKPLDKDTSNITGAIFTIESQTVADKKELHFINVDTSQLKNNTTFLYAPIGGKFLLDNITTSTPTIVSGSGIYADGANPLKMQLGKINVPDDVTFSNIFDVAMSTEGDPYFKEGYKDSSLTFLTNFEIDERLNSFAIANYHSGRFYNKKGIRRINGIVPPVAETKSYNGDIYTLKAEMREVGKPYEWVATKDNPKGNTSVWQATQWLTGGFTTEDLPVLTAFDVGAQNIDTTLNKVVTWSGTAWV